MSQPGQDRERKDHQREIRVNKLLKPCHMKFRCFELVLFFSLQIEANILSKQEVCNLSQKSWYRKENFLPFVDFLLQEDYYKFLQQKID